MDERTQQPIRRKRKQLAPWERTLRKIWPPLRLLLVGAVLVLLAVLLISLLISAIV